VPLSELQRISEVVKLVAQSATGGRQDNHR
jgi:hypothetical protein